MSKPVPRAAMRNAIGARDCDFIKLENRFARVMIEHQTQLTDGTGAAQYVVTGHTPDGRPHVYASVAEAYTYALFCLAAFVDGRGD